MESRGSLSFILRQGFEECEEAILSRSDAATPHVNLVCFYRQNTAPPKNLWPDLLDPFMRPASTISWSWLANDKMVRLGCPWDKRGADEPPDHGARLRAILSLRRSSPRSVLLDG